MTTNTRTRRQDSEHAEHLRQTLLHLRRARRSLRRLIALGPETCRIELSELDRDADFHEVCWQELTGIRWTLSIAGSHLASMSGSGALVCEDLRSD